jgi:hypothetical protein
MFSDHRIARVRLVFMIPSHAMNVLFPHTPATDQPKHLAYVEWFSDFPRYPDSSHRQFKVKPSLAPGGGNLASVVPITSVISSVHLLPKFGDIAPRHWTSSNVLDNALSFYVNSFGGYDRNIHDIINNY